MSAKTLDFYYDFGSPNVYFAWKALLDVKTRAELEITLHPVLIGGIFKSTGNKPPWMAFSGVPAKMQYMQLEIMRFIKAYDLNAFKFNSAFPVNTLLSMRGAIAAQNHGVHNTYFETVLTAIWEADKDISRPEVLSDVLNAAGLDGDMIVAQTQDPDVKAGLMEATQACVDRGAFGLPTFFLGDDMYFGKDRVHLIEKALG